MGSNSVWHLDKLCDPTNFVLVEFSRPMPCIIKHKPSSIVFSDRNESIKYDNLVRPEHKIFNYESSNGEWPSGQGSDDNTDSNDDVSSAFPGLHRQFIISQKRRSMHKARLNRRRTKKDQKPSPTVTETKQETMSTEVTVDEITLSPEEQVRVFYYIYF